ncbi:MAG: outer membrane protein assembly factor BamD [Gammaproteobacteria bacterium]|nr:outer membrane protein assembly factor BamD [Gammaproteobacteria bacterium]
MRILFVVAAALLIAGCANKDEVDPEQTELEFYESAQSGLRSGNYEAAIERLQLLEARFPFGRYAEQAQLEIIYAYYRSAQYESARSAADRFIRLHPQHPNVDYAYFLRGMASYEEDQNFLERFLPIDPAARDLGTARDSFNDFAQLVRRFPESKYAPDAQKRMIHLRNLLARHEVKVARYYITREAYVAAANRGRYVFEKFQGAPSVPDALAIMVQAYTLMGADELADESLMVLTSNYPDHSSLTDDGEFRKSLVTKTSDRSWLNIITFGLLG